MGKESFIGSLPPWAKGVLAVSVIAGVGFTVYAIHRYIKNHKNLEGAQHEVDATTQTTQTLTQSGQKPTLDALKLATISNQLFTAMDGYGTDVNGVYAGFANVNNDLDVVNLIKAYGIRELSTGSLNPSPNLKGTLSQALTDELSASEMIALNNMLAKKGIKYRF